MAELEKHRLVVGPFQCNCTILVCKKTNEALVIDAGDEYDRIEKKCKELGVTLKYSIHTHAHLDHIGAVSDLKRSSPETQILLHKEDEFLYDQLPMQGSMFGFQYEAPPKVNRYLNHEEELEIGSTKFKVIHTPGHSPGGVCLHFKEGVFSGVPEVFTGDTLFQLSVGRTDLWGANSAQMFKSIKERLLTLDEETRIHPGHGGSSSIGIEKRENPFLT